MAPKTFSRKDELHERSRLFILIGIMAIVSLLIAGTSIYFLYIAAFEVTRERLVDTVKTQSLIMEAVADFDSIYSADYPGGAKAATLSQIIDADEHFEGLGETGEIILAERREGKIFFLLDLRHSEIQKREPISFDSKLSEPMRLALQGKSGSIIGLDYRGEKVLAAYEPVRTLKYGVVAKMDLSEVRAPFIRAAIITFGVMLLLVTLGAFIFHRVTNSILTALISTSKNLLKAQSLAKVGFLNWDLKTNKVKWSDEMYDICGVETKKIELDFEFTINCVHPDDLDLVNNNIKTALESTMAYNFDYRILRPDGNVVWVAAVIESEQDIDGKPTNLIGTIHDITERKQAEKDLEKSFEQEARLRETLVNAEKLASLGEMAAKIAHEINNPLTVIMGQAELQAQQITDADLKKPYEMIGEKANQIKDLTRRYMDLAKPTEVKMKNLKFKDVVHDTIESIKPLGQLKHIEIVESYLEEEPEILGDPMSLEQVIRNLLINASDAFLEVASKKISVGTMITEDEKAIIAFVTDNGVGIKTEDISTIFDHYYTTKEKGKGTGLGLVVVKEIIEVMHGGNITVESEPGKGTTFYISIPLAEYSNLKKKILIADDEAYIVDLFSEYLSSMGFLIQSSQSGKEALEIYSDFKPDLVITDYEMPEMNGYELFKEIRIKNPKQAFIMITGAFLPPDILSLLKEKRIPQIIKPAELENELLKIVNEQLQSKW